MAKADTPARHALVIGNAAYSSEKMVLANPVNDARLIADKLRQLGFEVELQTDLGRARISEAVDRFTERLPDGATALFYYAGHGLQIGGENYLVPIDETLTGEQSAQLRTYPLRKALEKMSGTRSAVNILILDACRDNPFRPADKVRYRNMPPLGLAKIQAPRGTLIAYSTQPGQLAADGTGRHSVYTETLANGLSLPGLRLEDLFKRVNTLVRNKTRDDQIPWYESSLTEEFFLIPPSGVSVVAGQSLAGGDKSTNHKSRNMNQSAPPPLWYLKMSDYEWQKLDWDISQRARHLAGDELIALEQQANGGNVIAQTTLGLAYLEGTSSKRDPRTGRKKRIGVDEDRSLYWLKLAARNDFPIAQTLLAEMYFEARGVNRNLKEAIRLTDLAARANYPRAKLALAQFRGVESGQPDPKAYLDALGSAWRSLQIPSQPSPAGQSR